MYVDVKSKDISFLICKLRIYYYKTSKKKNKGQWTQQNFSKGICSVKTYYKIEKGKSRPKENILDLFLIKLGMKFRYVKELDNELSICLRKIIDGINFFDLAMIDSYATRLLQNLKSYQNLIYYKEVFFIINVMHNYYINSIYLNKEDYVYISYIYMVLGKEVADIGKDVLFKYLYIIRSPQNDYLEHIKWLHLERSTCTCNIINNFIFQVYVKDNKKLLLSFYHLEKLLLKKKNYVRCMDLNLLYLNSLLVFSYESIKDEFEKCIKKCNLLINKIGYEIKKAQFHINSGMLYMKLDKYEEALIQFTNCLNYKTVFQKFAFIFVCFISQQTGNISLCNFKKKLEYIDFNITYSPLINMMFDFFVYYIKGWSYKLLQEYLISNILVNINNNDEIFIRIFKYELILCAEKTRKYSDMKLILTKL